MIKKKLAVVAVLSVFCLGMIGCGHGSCDAYNKSDYQKYKVEHNQKMRLVQELTETQK